jgi:Ca-activated chloride channel family protein
VSHATVPVQKTTPVSLVLSFGADARDKGDAAPPGRRPLNLGLVLDRSGSMGGTPLRQAIKSAKALVDELTDKDRLSVVVFDDHIKTLVEPDYVRDKKAVQSAIDKVHAGGTTNLCGGWQQGGKHVQQHFSQQQVNRVLLLTDGHANVGTTDTPTLVKYAQDKAAAGVATTTLGFGTSFNEDLLIGMARAGEGNYYYIESHEDLQQILHIELEGLSSVCAQNLVVQIKPHAAVGSTTVLNQYRSEQKGKALSVSVGDVYAVEDKVLALDLEVQAGGAGPLPLLTVAYTYQVVEGGAPREVRGELEIATTAVPADQAATPDFKVVGQAMRLRAARAKDEAVELADRGKLKDAAKKLQQIAETLRQSSLANQFEFAEEVELLEHFAERLDKTAYDGVLRKELRDQSYQAGTRSRGDLAQRGTAGGSAAGLPTVTSDAGGIALRCEKVSGKLRIRVTADGFDPNKNVQFPRAIREEGVSYLVDQVVPSADGSFYRVQGTIRRLLRPGETAGTGRVSARKTTTASKAAKTPATAADLPTCTEIGSGVLVQCVPEGKKLRARVVSDGYNPDWNIRFPLYPAAS